MNHSWNSTDYLTLHHLPLLITSIPHSHLLLPSQYRSSTTCSLPCLSSDIPQYLPEWRQCSRSTAWSTIRETTLTPSPSHSRTYIKLAQTFSTDKEYATCIETEMFDYRKLLERHHILTDFLNDYEVETRSSSQSHALSIAPFSSSIDLILYFRTYTVKHNPLHAYNFDHIFVDFSKW